MKRNHLVIGIIILVITAAAGYALWNRHQTTLLRDATLARIDHATQALRNTIAPSTDPVAKSQAVSAAVDRIDSDLAALRAADTSRILLLGAGADTYLHSVRELLKRQAALLVLDSGLRHGITAFRDHLRSENRGATWGATAVQQKNRLEQDFREYRSAFDAHTRIIDGLPDALKTLSAQAPEITLPSAAEVANLRSATMASAAAITSEMETLRRIAAPR